MCSIFPLIINLCNIMPDSKVEFTLYQIVKQNVAKCVLDRVSVYTEGTGSGKSFAPEKHCSTLLLKVKRSVMDSFLSRPSVNAFYQSTKTAMEPLIGKSEVKTSELRCDPDQTEVM